MMQVHATITIIMGYGTTRCPGASPTRDDRTDSSGWQGNVTTPLLGLIRCGRSSDDLVRPSDETVKNKWLSIFLGLVATLCKMSGYAQNQVKMYAIYSLSTVHMCYGTDWSSVYP